MGEMANTEKQHEINTSLERGNQNAGFSDWTPPSNPGVLPVTPPPYTYYPQAAAPTTPPVKLLDQLLSEKPMDGICPSCNQRVVTEIKYVTGWYAFWMTVLIIFAVLVFIFVVGILAVLLLGLWAILYFSGRLPPTRLPVIRDVVHHCPNCQRLIGRYKQPVCTKCKCKCCACCREQPGERVPILA